MRWQKIFSCAYRASGNGINIATGIEFTETVLSNEYILVYCGTSF